LSSTPTIRCKYSAIASIDTLKPHPHQTNTHTDEQIDLLAKIINYQGWRSPVLVSNRSKCIVAGHGRVEAAKKLGLTQVPVDYQQFDSDDQETAFVTSDNAIAELSKIDLSIVNQLIPELGPEFDLELLGLPDLKLDPSELQNDQPQTLEDVRDTKTYACPHCNHSLKKDDLIVL
jgi:ParB-like chromosome segregation protein Spo0J